MSDYLSNLAARTTESAALLQPRLPSVFETSPDSPHLSSFAEGQRSGEADETAETQSTTPPRTDRIAQAQDRPLTPEPLPVAPQPIAEESESNRETPVIVKPAGPPSLPVARAPQAMSQPSDQGTSASQMELNPTQTEKGVSRPTKGAQKEVVKHVVETVFLERVVKRNIADHLIQQAGGTVEVGETPQIQQINQPVAASDQTFPGSRSHRDEMAQVRTQLIQLPAETSAVPSMKNAIEDKPDKVVPIGSRQAEAVQEPRLSYPREILQQDVNRLKREGVPPQTATVRFAPPELPQLKPEQERQPAEVAPPPTIEVHIGRIEVRATPAVEPPAPTRRKTEPSAVLSLDDYLRQRNGHGNKR